MDYEKLMLQIKNEYFPELKDVNVHLKPLKILDSKIFEKISFRPLMWVFMKNIYYNEKGMKRRRYDDGCLRSILAHELAHIIQTIKMNWFQEILFNIHTIIDRKYNSKIEKRSGQNSN